MAPENAWVVMLDGRIDDGIRFFVEVTMWPSAPQSSIDGTLDVLVVEFMDMNVSGGCGGGLLSGGGLTQAKNFGSQLA